MWVAWISRTFSHLPRRWLCEDRTYMEGCSRILPPPKTITSIYTFFIVQPPFLLQYHTSTVVDDGQQYGLVPSAGALDADEAVLPLPDGRPRHHQEGTRLVVLLVDGLHTALDGSDALLEAVVRLRHAVAEGGGDPVDQLRLLGRHRLPELVGHLQLAEIRTLHIVLANHIIL